MLARIIDREIPITSKVNGIAIKWACRSANKKEKNGNSVISCPGGSGGIMRLLLQKSKDVIIVFPDNFSKRRFDACKSPSRLPITHTNATAVIPVRYANTVCFLPCDTRL